MRGLAPASCKWGVGGQWVGRARIATEKAAPAKLHRIPVVIEFDNKKH